MYEQDVVRELRRLRHLTDRNSPGVPTYVQRPLLIVIGIVLLVAIVRNLVGI